MIISKSKNYKNGCLDDAENIWANDKFGCLVSF